MNCNLLICTNTSKHCSWKRCFFVFQNCNTVTVTLETQIWRNKKICKSVVRFMGTVILLYCNAWTDVIVWSGFVDCHYCECASTSSSRLPRHLHFTVLKVNSSADPHNFLRSPLRIAISFSWILSLDFIPGFHPSFSRHGRIKASFILLIWLNENVFWCVSASPFWFCHSAE